MPIIKSLVCAVFLLVQVTNAELYVNCMAATAATPEASECTDVRPYVRQDVLDMLDVCTGGLDMGYVEQQARRRQLRSREQAEGQSKRELQWLAYCNDPNISGGDRMICCMMGAGYCGSPTGNRRLQEGDGYSETALAAIAAECTEDFKVLANETEGCFGSSEDVFCETIQVLIG
jgi:hypothetical protein